MADADKENSGAQARYFEEERDDTKRRVEAEKRKIARLEAEKADLERKIAYEREQPRQRRK